MKNSMTKKEFIRRKALGIDGLLKTDIDPRTRDARLTYINNIDEVQKAKLEEYNVWYIGDGQEIQNFYTRASAIDYNTDPMYQRNKKSYFWSVSSTEDDIKRTHSGMPRNIVDTLVNVVGMPQIGVGEPYSVLKELDDRLHVILNENNFTHMLVQQARPLTLVEGWGAWKINWDTSFSDTPILLYYRAEAVDFCYRDNRLSAIIYQDYYQNEKGENYVLFETRRLERREVKNSKTGITEMAPCLIIEKDLFKIMSDSDVMMKVELSELPQLRDVKERYIVDHFNRFLGAPCIYYDDPTGDCYGRSIFTGKIDLFDDLDQCHSQAANTVRRSTVHEYFNTLYLEKDEHTGMPVMPKDFDRKYVMFRGVKSGDGQVGTSTPVQVTQPSVDFTQYSAEEQNILINIVNGIMSPATLGIDIAKKDNAASEREKEKVTIFNRNTIMDEERKSITDICNDLLIADELMRTGRCTCKKYSVYVQYDEFADSSFESKLEAVVGGWQAGIMSDEMAIDYLYKDSVSPEIKERELKFMKDNRASMQAAPQAPGENDYNDMMAAVADINDGQSEI